MITRVRLDWARLPRWARWGLVVLDPLVLVLVGLARPAGVWLACTVLLLDNAANWIANWPGLRDDPLRLVESAGLLPITAFSLFVLVTAPLLLATMRDRG